MSSREDDTSMPNNSNLRIVAVLAGFLVASIVLIVVYSYFHTPIFVPRFRLWLYFLFHPPPPPPPPTPPLPPTPPPLPEEQEQGQASTTVISAQNNNNPNTGSAPNPSTNNDDIELTDFNASTTSPNNTRD